MAASALARGPIMAPESEKKALSAVERALQKSRRGRAQLVGPDGRRTLLPRSLYVIIRDAVRQLMHGNGVSILPVMAELTTQQAAEQLNVSRPFLIKLLERHEMPFHHVGTHRRIYLRDLLAYKSRRDAAAKRAVDDLARESQELGIYNYDE
jgi:excisionase family DNA binding protein